MILTQEEQKSVQNSQEITEITEFERVVSKSKENRVDLETVLKEYEINWVQINEVNCVNFSYAKLTMFENEL